MKRALCVNSLLGGRLQKNGVDLDKQLVPKGVMSSISRVRSAVMSCDEFSYKYIFSDVMATCEPATSISISASSYLKSSLTICYRAMPHSHEDGRLRPDLRLGISEPCVRKVANVVHWFERTTGLAG